MRRATAVIIGLLIGGTGSSAAEPIEWERVPVDPSETAFVSVDVHPGNPSHILAATARAFFESLDGGRRWQHRFSVPGQATIREIAVSPHDIPSLLLATDQGLYGSQDGGDSWLQPYKGVGEGEAQCTSVAFHPSRADIALLGTQGGLLISPDRGQHWTELTMPLAARSVISFSFDPEHVWRLYVVAAEGLFVGDLTTGSWEQRVNSPPAEEESADTDAPEADELEEAADSPSRLRAVVADPQHPATLYLAGSRGLEVSHDRGVSWVKLTNSGLISARIVRLLPYHHSPLVLYAATAQGLARYEPQRERWTTLGQGLFASRINDLAGSPQQLWAATDQGLYRYQISPDMLTETPPPSPQELLSNFSHEPTIAQVRDAAIRYAEVHPEKIRRWRRQAALQALLPSVDIGWDRDRADDTSIDEGSFPNFQLIDTMDTDASLDFSITWNLGELLWNPDQTSIDVRSKLMVQLRDDIVDEVTRTYFERRRLQVTLLTNPPEASQQLLEKELRLQELTALLDGLTGGDFSKDLDVLRSP